MMNVTRRLEIVETVFLKTLTANGNRDLTRETLTRKTSVYLPGYVWCQGLPTDQLFMYMTLTLLPNDPNVSLCLTYQAGENGNVPFKSFDAQLWILNKNDVVLHKTAVKSRRSLNNKATGFCPHLECPCQKAPFHIAHSSICPSSIIWKELENVPAGQSLNGCIRLKLKMGFNFDSSTTGTSISSFNQNAQTPLLTSYLIDKGDTFDFTIRAGKDLKSEFKAHKCVLAARSSFFSAMFKSGMKESTENVMECSAIDPNLMDVFIKFLYGVDSVVSESVEDVDLPVELLKIADMYQVADLTQFSIQHLLQLPYYTVKIALKIFSALQTMINTELEFRAVEHLKRAAQSGELEKDVDFRNFIVEEPDMATRLFTRMASIM